MQEIVNKINSETPDTLKTNAIDEEGKTANVRLAENLKKIIELRVKYLKEEGSVNNSFYMTESILFTTIVFSLNILKKYLMSGKKLKVSNLLEKGPLQIIISDDESCFHISEEMIRLEKATYINLKTELYRNGARELPERVTNADSEKRYICYYDQNWEIEIYLTFYGPYLACNLKNNGTRLIVERPDVTDSRNRFNTFNSEIAKIKDMKDVILPVSYLPEELIPEDIINILELFPEGAELANFIWEALKAQARI